MPAHHGIVDAIGNTPLIRLQRASEATGCTILGKAEFMNPGQSVKDRAALFIIQDAEERGLLRPGGVIVEGTAGNTGIGLALVGNALGYRTVIVIPDTQTQEKKDMLRLCGAELIEVPAVPYANPNNYVKVSGRIAERLAKTEPNGAIWANQFDNVANRDGACRDHGPRDLGADGRPYRRLHLRRRHGRHARRRRHGAQGAQPGHRHRPRRSAWELRSTAITRRGELKADGIVDHRGHRAGPDHEESRRIHAGRRVPDPGRGGDPARLRSAGARRPVPRRLVRHQCRRRDPPRAPPRARATRS